MNERPFLPLEDDSCFDRLVDGELPAEEYRRLLASLDDEPGLWRRCGLAFLEAQALGQEFSAARRELDRPAVGKKADPTGPRFRVGTLCLAMAASFLLALGLGAFSRGWTLPAGWFAAPTRAIVKQQPSHRPTVEKVGPELVQDDYSGGGPMGKLTLVVDSGQGSKGQQIELPVYDSQEAQRWLSQERSALPADVRQALERMGHRVEQHQQLMPVDLQDGRQVVVPVEQYRIVPVSRRPY